MPKSLASKKDNLKFVRWSLLIVILITGFVNVNLGVLALLVYILPSIFVFLHGSKYLGWKNILIFFVLICAVTYTAEYLGVHTGKIFGDYYYNAIGNGPLIGGVPPLLMLTYFSLAYGCYMVARILLGSLGKVTGWSLIGLSSVGAMLMSLNDLASDPTSSTINHVYTWVLGGAYFGVPYLNFVGWFGESLVFFVALSVVYAYITKVPKQDTFNKWFLLEALVLFAAPVLPIIFRPLWQPQPEDIRQSLSLVALFGLGTIILVAKLRLWWPQSKKRS